MKRRILRYVLSVYGLYAKIMIFDKYNHALHWFVDSLTGYAKTVEGHILTEQIIFEQYDEKVDTKLTHDEILKDPKFNRYYRKYVVCQSASRNESSYHILIDKRIVLS